MDKLSYLNIRRFISIGTQIVVRSEEFLPQQAYVYVSRDVAELQKKEYFWVLIEMKWLMFNYDNLSLRNPAFTLILHLVCATVRKHFDNPDTDRCYLLF